MRKNNKTFATWLARSGGVYWRQKVVRPSIFFYCILTLLFSVPFLDFLDPGRRPCGMDARHTFAAFLNSQHIWRATAQSVGRHSFFLK